MQAVKGNVQNHLESGMVIEQCRYLLSTRVGVSLSFVKRQANRVAHLLARLSCALNSFIDISFPPRCVLETLKSDV